MPEDFRLKDLKARFFFGYEQYRIKRITIRDYNEILLEIWTILLTEHGQIEPYYSLWKKEAEDQFEQSLKNRHGSDILSRITEKSREQLRDEREALENSRKNKFFQNPSKPQ